MTDEELYAAYRLGDESAFNTLYQRHSGRAYGYLLKRLKSPEEADEVFQAAFLKLHRSRDTLSTRYPFLQSLFVVLRSSVLDHWKKSKASRETLVSDIYFFKGVPDPNAQGFMGSEGKALNMESGIGERLEALPDLQKRALGLRFIDELTYLEIAKQLDRGEPAIRQLISRGLKRLRQGNPK